jgi:hypothetical protein
MTRRPPKFFESIRRDSQRLWEKLEKDPVLAAPWHQMFRQIQSMDHVLSELLQNADDAKATWARARVEGNRFVFEHDGMDFDESSLRSLCRFGFSNKNNLHTIGFRGLGFKSTFSLGSVVAVHTPTLAFQFTSTRFTEPVWDANAQQIEFNRVSIEIQRGDIATWMRRHLKMWLDTAAPVLFFRNLRSLELQGRAIVKRAPEPGPVENSDWVEIDGSVRMKLLHIRSPLEAFPADAIEEVRRERSDPHIELPPCTVEIILGLPEGQKLFVVLPTRATPALPFSCNAPFLQDPARTAIKNPVTSPTNGWLLRRIGKLAADTLRAWLSNRNLSLSERAHAYTLVPDAKYHSDDPLNADCTEAVIGRFRTCLENKPILLAQNGTLVNSDKCLAVPADLLGVWPAKHVLEVFGSSETHVLAAEVTAHARSLLKKWKLLEPVLDLAIFNRLTREPYPLKPQNDRLLTLWSYLEQTRGHIHFRRFNELAIVPVRSQSTLHPAATVTVLASKESRLKEADWKFLQGLTFTLDRNWAKLMVEATQQPNAETTMLVDPTVQRAISLFHHMDLNRRTSLENLAAQAAQRVFILEDPGDEGLRLAHVFAAANILAPDSTMYLCEDGQWKKPSENLVYAVPPGAEELLPLDWKNYHLLSVRYSELLTVQQSKIWREWAGSPKKSRLSRFAEPKSVRHDISSKSQLEYLIRERGGTIPLSYPYKSTEFFLADWDFDESLLQHWECLAEDNERIWADLLLQVLRGWEDRWLDWCEAQARQLGTRNSQRLEAGNLPAAWLYRLRGKNCIPDRFDRLKSPYELLRLTSETDALVGIDDFVHREYDLRDSSRLLDALGVGNRPPNAAGLLSRLRYLSQVKGTPPHYVVKLYEALNQVFVHVTPDEIRVIKANFESEKLVLAEDGSWQEARSVFCHNEEGMPGALCVVPEAAELNLWHVLGVPPRPTLDFLLGWLSRLPSRLVLSSENRVRVRKVLGQAPFRIWEELGHWLSLDSRWTPVSELRYKSGSDQDIFPAIKAVTADLSILPMAQRIGSPFHTLANLDTELEIRPTKLTDAPQPKITPSWISSLAKNLALVQLNQAHLSTGLPQMPRVDHLRETALRLAKTVWRPAIKIEVSPHIGGQPVGDARNLLVLWSDLNLHVVGDGPRHHRDLAKEIVSQLPEELHRAVHDCIDREPTWIDAYFNAHFQLVQQQPELNSEPGKGVAISTNIAVEGYREVVLEPLPPVVNEVNGSVQFPTSSASGNKLTQNQIEANKSGQFKLFESYLMEQGYIWHPKSKRFMSSSGAFVAKGKDLFPWIGLDSEGMLMQNYWIADKSLNEGIEIPSQVWEAIKRQQEHSYVIVLDGSGVAKEYPGKILGEWLLVRQLELFPVSYRLKTAVDSRN